MQFKIDKLFYNYVGCCSHNMLLTTDSSFVGTTVYHEFNNDRSVFKDRVRVPSTYDQWSLPLINRTLMLTSVPRAPMI